MDLDRSTKDINVSHVARGFKTQRSHGFENLTQRHPENANIQTSFLDCA